jgi:AcrR family transcriptional regulator
MATLDPLAPSEQNPALAPEDRILAATLACVDGFGLKTVTVRIIAARAGLNAAAVNYYFGSKESLVEKALRDAWSRLIAELEGVAIAAGNSREALRGLVRLIIELSYRHPRLMLALLVEHDALRRETLPYIRGLFARFPRIHAGSEGDLATTLLLSLCVLIGHGEEGQRLASGGNLDDIAAREGLAAELVEKLF